VRLAADAAQVIRSRDVELAAKLQQDDDAMDDLHRHLFTVLMAATGRTAWPPPSTWRLLGRFYERFADHAVAIARQVVFVVTGQLR